MRARQARDPAERQHRATDDDGKGSSASQQSYTQLTEHWDDLIELLESSGIYTPNETDLKLPALTACFSHDKFLLRQV